MFVLADGRKAYTTHSYTLFQKYMITSVTFCYYIYIYIYSYTRIAIHFISISAAHWTPNRTVKSLIVSVVASFKTTTAMMKGHIYSSLIHLSWFSKPQKKPGFAEILVVKWSISVHDLGTLLGMSYTAWWFLATPSWKWWSSSIGMIGNPILMGK